MRHHGTGLLLGVVASLAASTAMFADEPRTRTFHFNYETTVTGLSPGQVARVWLPMPPTNADQRVEVVSERAPISSQRGRDPEHGNEILYFAAPADEAGRVSIAMVYRVERLEVRAESSSQIVTGGETAPPQIARFLRPDALVPVDGKASMLLESRAMPEEPVSLGRSLYDIVLDHMSYSKKGEGWGRGDAEWACVSRFGNCSDFHSLFIALARASGLPARFEIGFPLPPRRGAGEIGGYHCWAKFHAGERGWVPVDISEADKDPSMTEYYFGNLTQDRVTFSIGRDIQLVPRQSGEPLNFFIYPHVEVDAQPYPDDRVERRLTFQDISD